MCMEPTGLDEECQLFRVRKSLRGSGPSHCCLTLLQVTEAFVRETAMVSKDMVDVEHVIANPPSLEWPRLRCFLFFGDEDPTKPCHGRIEAWCAPGLQDMYNMDKDASRSASRLAISHLLEEINVLRKPQQTGETLKLKVALGKVFPGLPVEVLRRDNEEPTEQYLNRIIKLNLRKSDGSGS